MSRAGNGVSFCLFLPDLVSTKSGRACLPPAGAKTRPPGRRGLIFRGLSRPTPPLALRPHGLQARDRASLPRKAAVPVPVPKTGGMICCEVANKP